MDFEARLCFVFHNNCEKRRQKTKEKENMVTVRKLDDSRRVYFFGSNLGNLI